ncbi:MAG: HAMP domain-containing sensor histidine kinase [Candidatus Yanofskybacteria bacterium]|nr:HAMP domain-containing sensor histidine kinase [Candidatus Yanofskybacteria bacterium]
MTSKEFFERLNPFADCTKYRISLWQCPQFLFVVMGFLIIISMLLLYGVGTRFIEDPYMVSLIIIFVTAGLLVLSYLVTKSFERLAEASRMKSEFVSIVSHQLRAPISNLKWALEFLLSGRLGQVNPNQQSYFTILKDNSARMHNLVNDLLSVSRIEQNDLPFQAEQFSFPALVESVVAEFKPILTSSNIEIALEGEELPSITSDPGKIRQVLSNLLDNAIRYAWKDGETGATKAKKRVAIRYFRRGAFLQFEIEDNGVGIPQRDHKYIFQRFFRSSNALRHETQGTGLGLYIVKSILEKAGGKIQFSSKENKGSKFWFIIPLS